MQDKVVVVTGAGSGIGRELALAMARQGAKVVVNDIGASLAGDATGLDPGQQVVEEIKAFGGHAIANADSVSEAAEVNGQVFAVRNNEIFLMSQPRPLRAVHRSEGWTPETIASHCIPSLKASFYDLDRSADVFSWDPI